VVQFTAHSDGKVLVPDEPVKLAKGRRFMVTLEPVGATRAKPLPPARWFQKAVELSQRMPRNLPKDLGEQHDHYIHGTPKR
jgi:hypothetical protein